MFGVLELNLCVHLDIVVYPRRQFIFQTTRSQKWKSTWDQFREHFRQLGMKYSDHFRENCRQISMTNFDQQYMRVNFPVWLSDAHSSSSFELSENHREKVETWELQGRGCQRALPGRPRPDSAPPSPFSAIVFFLQQLFPSFPPFFESYHKKSSEICPCIVHHHQQALPARRGNSRRQGPKWSFLVNYLFAIFFGWISLKIPQHFFDNFESTCIGCYLVINTSLMICLFRQFPSKGFFYFF